MYKIVRKKALNPTVTQMEIEAPLVARKAKPGQFIILRVDADGERTVLREALPQSGAQSVSVTLYSRYGGMHTIQIYVAGELIAERQAQFR